MLTTSSISTTILPASTLSLLKAYHIKWGGSELGSGVTIKYFFPTTPNEYGLNYYGSEPASFTATSAYEQSGIIQAFEILSRYADIDFQLANSASDADFNIGIYNNMDPSYAAYAYTPGNNTVNGDIWLNGTYFKGTNTPSTQYGFEDGDYGLYTILHELGHSLGLSHPNNVGTASGFTRANTMMSYNKPLGNNIVWEDNGNGSFSGSYVNSDTPMILDILALQTLYGVNTTYNATDTVYSFSTTGIDNETVFDITKPMLKTIWDANGEDTIDLTGIVKGSILNLNEGKMSSIRLNNDTYGLSREYDGTNNFGIAYGAIIENAIGGSGNDTIYGNLVDNIINGMEGNDIIKAGIGNDTIYGGLGNDIMYGEAGNDTYYVDSIYDKVIEINAKYDIDTVISDVDFILGNYIENLTLASNAIKGTGNTLSNTIIGNSEDNIIDGKANADTMYGGAGNDTYYVDNINDIVSEEISASNTNNAGGNDTVYSTINYTLGDYVENLTLIGKSLQGTGNSLNNIINGNNYSNKLYGLDGDDTLNGGVGNDTLDGGLGNDTLDGGVGNDTLDGGVGSDTMYGGVGNDTYYVDNVNDVVEDIEIKGGTDTVKSTISYTLGNYIENLTLIGINSINGTGNINNNKIIGNEADNSLYGLEGNDILYGGLGNDTLDGGVGNDTMYGEDGDDTYYVDSKYDKVIETKAINGVDTVVSSIDYTLGNYVENLTLASNAMKGTGNTLSNTIIGNSEDNIIDGKANADTMYGGAGNDTYYVDNINDIVSEEISASNTNNAGGNDTVYSTINYTLGDYVENLTLIGKSLQGTGNSLNNIINGNSYSNILNGLDGDDTLNGGSGNDTLNGDVGDDTLNGGVGNDTLDGGLGNDTLDGGVGNDILDGGVGIDTMYGGVGNDTYYVDNVNDVVEDIEIKGGTDTVKSTISYTLGNYIENLTLIGINSINGTGNINNNKIIGNEADNSLYGLEGNDILYGGLGNDTLDGGVGNDTMYGQAGDDTYYIDSKYDKAIELNNEGLDTVVSSIDYTLGNYVENLTLASNAIKGTGNTLSNTIIGNSEDNIIDGKANADTMYGGAGNDTYYVDNINDIVSEEISASNTNNAGGNDTVYSTINYTLGDYVENLTLIAKALEGTGNSLDNIINGNSYNNILNGLAGDDTLNGGAGNDILDGGIGDDTMYGGIGNDIYRVDSLGDVVVDLVKGGGTDTVETTISYTIGDYIENLTLLGTNAIDGTGNIYNNKIIGNDANNKLYGLTGNDILYGEIGNDTLDGGIGNDTLYGGVGNDILEGGAGNDTMYGQEGDDTYYVDSIYDKAIEVDNAGTDTVVSTVSYTIGNYVENITLSGNQNINATGNTGDNTIIGNSANNVIVGGLGNDILTGGGGSDTFLFNTLASGTNFDTITDFTSGVDKIKLSTAIFSKLVGIKSFQNNFSIDNPQDTNDYIIYNSNTGVLSYDSDGSGVKDAIDIALLGTTTHPTITYSDLII